MYLSRIVVKNYRSLKAVDVPITRGSSVVIGENNTGKSNLFQALRICLDVQLSSAFRSLLKEDIHCQVDQAAPFQVLIGAEFSDFQGNENEEALLHGTQIDTNRARLFYRFRPKRSVREALSRNEQQGPLTLEHFAWELSGGGNAQVDLTEIEWHDELGDLGATNISLQYLQSYMVVFLPALRDVEADLQTRRSTLARLIEASQIGAAEQKTLIDAVKAANSEIESSPTIQAIAEAIDGAFKEITGPAFTLDVDLGLSAPTFQSIIRNLVVLLTTNLVTQFEPRRNGLGFNNILYIAILVEYFRKRSANGRSAGELILIEEPEAHLHPQLQSTLIEALRSLPFQSLVSTHSTQVTAKVPLDAYVVLTTTAEGTPFGAAPATTGLSAADQQDLNRYLDATKSNLLFARKVMLVEGVAELFLVPPLVKQIMGVDLEREGISVVAIHGAHFSPFARLFNGTCLPKACAIVGDADHDPEAVAMDDDDLPIPANLGVLENQFVRVFLGATTFERELTTDGNLKMLAAAAHELGAPRLKNALQTQEILGGHVPVELKAKVLRTAKRFGKGRFAQVTARHVAGAGDLPPYIFDAVQWLLAQ